MTKEESVIAAIQAYYGYKVEAAFHKSIYDSECSGRIYENSFYKYKKSLDNKKEMYEYIISNFKKEIDSVTNTTLDRIQEIY